ncbi:Hypothetical predicted protein [Mytilus galloprovincialis]|uniref:SRCR domain-containing protein n=1 Tax=Mytilus galloprovincialis TaxID=29158 RepID=A0A8B6HRK3_MYTGA|nr:Hypothetical predicted protein [Mytilus galloprovincialis]
MYAGVRLAGGNGPWEGTVEVNVDRSWGTICNHNFDLSDARVICRMLGFKREIHIWGVAALGQGTEKILLTDLSCTGYELNVGSCGYHTTYCRQNQAIGISCVRIRLIGGTGPYEGTIELNVNGEWGTICSKQFDINDANVICRMAGFTSGSENNIDSCGSDGWYRSSCSHDRDAGVACLNDMCSDRQNIIQGVKLVGGNSPFEGRVELNLNGQWGTICGKTKFDINAADVICRMAGYSRSLQHFSFSHFGEGNGSIVLSNPQCSGKEDIIDDCGSNGWYNSGSCTHYNDVGVICKTILINWLMTYNISTETTNQSTKSCRHQSFYAIYYKKETSLADSQQKRCKHIRISIIKKMGDLSRITLIRSPQMRRMLLRTLFEGIRLVGGAGPFEGRVEININGQWGTICDTDFDLADAEVLCRMAGYSRALRRFFGAYFGEGNGRVFLDHLRCSGKEQHLDSCPSSGLFLTSCQHSNDIGVSCQSVNFPISY